MFVRVSSFKSIHDFHVVKEKYMRWLPAIQEEINSEETIAQARKLKPQSPKIGDIILAAKGDLYHRAKIIDLVVSDNVLAVHALHIDSGAEFKLALKDILPCPQKFQEIHSMAFKCSMFGCFSSKQETDDLFKDLVRNEILELHVMGVDNDKKLLEVDLLRLMEGAYTSVRDCLVFGGKAVFEKNPYVAVPICNKGSFAGLPPLKQGTAYEVFISHVPEIGPGEEVQICVQVVSPLMTNFLEMSQQLVNVYGATNSEVRWSLTEQVVVGDVVAVLDSEDRGWYRGLVIHCVSERMMICRYVDFGNEELVSVHRVRRLLPEFLEVPAMMIPVYVLVQIQSLQQGDMIREELRQNLLYKEVVLKVEQVTDDGKVIVNMETICGVDIKSFMELLKQ